MKPRKYGNMIWRNRNLSDKETEEWLNVPMGEMKKPNRNSKILEDFVNYCFTHGNERFWQALRNWSGFAFVGVVPTEKINFKALTMKGKFHNAIDTFYFEAKDK